MRYIIIAILLLSLSGCSSLIVRETDDPVMTTAKVATRVLIFVPTMFMSELVIDAEKQEEQRQAEAAAYARWYNSLSPQQRAIEDQREHERDLVRMQAASMMLPSLMYNANQSFNSMRMTPPVPMQPLVSSPPTVSCRTYPIGSNLNTDCR